MRVLIVHNFHRPNSASGDDAVVKREHQLLKRRGHEVRIFRRENSEIYRARALQRLRMAAEIPWSRANYLAMRREIKEFQPAIVHFHNFFPLLSPSVYLAAHHEGIPTVQSLHDYRFFCPAAFLFRKGEICRKCPERGLHRAVFHRCLRGSLPQSLLAALATAKARKSLGLITSFIVFSPSSKDRMAEMGIERDRIFVKPHFLLPEEVPTPRATENYFLFAGRLGEEKGLKVLLKAWESLDLPLKIAGSGPLESLMKDLPPGITYCGFLERKRMQDAMSRAYALVVPSLSPETFGLTVMEAYAAGVPVLASTAGALQDLVEHGETGLLFERANPSDLKEKVRWLRDHPHERERMGRKARMEFEKKFTSGENYRILMEIYEKTLKNHEGN